MKIQIFKIGRYSGQDKLSQDFGIIFINKDPKPPIDHYINTLKKEGKGSYLFITGSDIVKQDPNYFGNINSQFNMDDDQKPEIGKCFGIGNFKPSGWRTTKVIDIITESIFVTENSVYAIHNIGLFRQQRLNDIL